MRPRGAKGGGGMVIVIYKRGERHRHLILSSEPDASARAEGWRQVAEVHGHFRGGASRPRHAGVIRDKRRWEAPLPAPELAELGLNPETLYVAA